MLFNVILLQHTYLLFKTKIANLLKKWYNIQKSCPEVNDMRKRITIGIDNFDTLIRENYYFADKSLLIRDIMESEDAKVILLPRPRRFGKSDDFNP